MAHHFGQHRTPQGSTTARGYGTAHQKLRALLIAAWWPGQPCAMCGDPMYGPPRRLHLAHNEDRTAYLGLAHDTCNVKDGQVRGGIKSAALQTGRQDARRATGRQSRQW